MTKKNLFKEAHKMAREIKREYPDVDYRFQFGLCLTYLLNKEEEKVESKLTWDKLEKQLEKAVEEKGYSNYYVNNWNKGENDRSYIELRWYRNGKLKEVKKCGYWDNVKEEYVVESKFQKNYNIFEL